MTDLALFKYNNEPYLIIYKDVTMSKRTFQPNKEKRKKKIGFMARMATPGGRAVLSARRKKGRAKLSA